MKNFKKIFLGILCMVVMPQLVAAAKVDLTCDNTVYTVQKTDTHVLTFGNGRQYNMNTYTTAGVARTYCLDPGGYFHGGKSGTREYVCRRAIDVTGETTGVGSYEHALDVSYAYAYKRIAENYNSESRKDKMIGEMVFRFLKFNFLLGSTKDQLAGTKDDGRPYFTMEQGGVVPGVWDTIQGEEEKDATRIAKELYAEAATVGNKVLPPKKGGQGMSYADLVRTGDLPDETFTYTVNQSDLGFGRRSYTFTFTSPNGATVWWDEFEFKVNNESARIESINHASGSNSYQVVVYSVNGSTDYSLSVVANYYLPSAAQTGMKILQAKSNPNNYQEMLIVATNPDAAKKTVNFKREIPLSDGCVQKNGTWYWCNYENGVETNCRLATPEDHCEVPTTPSGPTCEVKDGTFYGSAGTVVTPLVFYNECCEVPGLLTPEEYDLYCPCGEPDIDFIGNCSEFDSDSEIVNTVSDTKDGADLKNCLFNMASVDAAGNSVNMTDSQPTDIVSNRYCKVSCIEEYEFTLPNAKYTTSGGYFSLSSEISGKRTCYVNSNQEKTRLNGTTRTENEMNYFNGVDYQLFIDDLLYRSQQLANAQTIYNKMKAISESSYTSDSGNCGSCSENGVVVANEEINWATCSASQVANGDGTYRIVINCNGSDKIEAGSKTDGSKCGESCKGGCSNCVPPTSCTTTCDSEGTVGNYDNVKASLMDNKSLSDYAAAVTSAQSLVENVIKMYQDCNTGWDNNFSFDPVVKFKYDEPYDNITNDTFEKISESSSSSATYCVTVDDNYNCTNTTNSPYNQYYYKCTGSGGCTQTYSNIYSARYLTKTKSTTATYEPRNHFSVYTPIGTIVLNKEDGLYTVLCKDNDCLPVALNTPTGVFNFKFSFSKIGQYNDSNENGRLMGGTNNVFDAVNIEAGYVCQYINNCPECDYTCVGESCEITPDPDCPDCPFVCQNCIFDGSENTYYYRTVSVNALFPNEREYGPNWSNEKGAYTKNQIQERGEEVYGDPEYAYEITANQMRNIREYNKSLESSGGYLNTVMPSDRGEALVCEDREVDGTVYENVVCYSSFLDTTGNKYFYFKEIKRNDTWTLWPESEYFRNNNTKYVYQSGIGPSWK